MESYSRRKSRIVEGKDRIIAVEVKNKLLHPTLFFHVLRLYVVQNMMLREMGETERVVFVFRIGAMEGVDWEGAAAVQVQVRPTGPSAGGGVCTGPVDHDWLVPRPSLSSPLLFPPALLAFDAKKKAGLLKLTRAIE